MCAVSLSLTFTAQATSGQRVLLLLRRLSRKLTRGCGGASRQWHPLGR